MSVPGHPGRVNSLVPVGAAFFFYGPRRGGGTPPKPAGPAPPIYRVSASCNGVLCRTIRGCGYHVGLALTTSPNRRAGTAARLRNTPPNASKHGHSAVDVNRLAGDIAGLVRAEINRGRSDVARRSKPCRRNLGQDGLALLCIQRIRHWRCNKTWCNAIGGDVALRVFPAQRFDQTD